MKNKTVEAVLKINKVFNRYFAASDFGKKAKDYSRMEWYVLNFISLQPNITEGDLYRLIPTDESKVKRAIRKLGRARLIYRSEEQVGDENILELTPKGERECREAEAIDNQIASEILKRIGPDSAVMFESSLSKTLDLLTPEMDGFPTNN